MSSREWVVDANTVRSRQEHVVVVGAGAMGSAAAWRLALRGCRVTLLEQFEPGHVRGASHGSSRIFRHAYADRRYVDLAARAAALWSELEDADGTRLLTWTGAVDHGDPGAVQTLARVLGQAGVATRSSRRGRRGSAGPAWSSTPSCCITVLAAGWTPTGLSSRCSAERRPRARRSRTARPLARCTPPDRVSRWSWTQVQ